MKETMLGMRMVHLGGIYHVIDEWHNYGNSWINPGKWYREVVENPLLITGKIEKQLNLLETVKYNSKNVMPESVKSLREKVKNEFGFSKFDYYLKKKGTICFSQGLALDRNDGENLVNVIAHSDDNNLEGIVENFGDKLHERILYETGENVFFIFSSIKKMNEHIDHIRTKKTFYDGRIGTITEDCQCFTSILYGDPVCGDQEKFESMKKKVWGVIETEPMIGAITLNYLENEYNRTVDNRN